MYELDTMLKIRS